MDHNDQSSIESEALLAKLEEKGIQKKKDEPTPKDQFALSDEEEEIVTKPSEFAVKER